MADIFVSYANEDRARVGSLVGEIEADGFSVWWDRELIGGDRFSAEIEGALTVAAVVIVVWSPKAIKSRWVADEADLALEKGNMLPISLDGARPPMGFRQFQTIDFSQWQGQGGPCLTALLDALRHQLTHGTKTPQKAIELPATPEVKSDVSIAVLPFVNMSSDPEQEYFSDGISEELLNLLAKIKEMTVIARTSSFAFKGKDKSISEIGAILGVAYVLEGSVRKAGDRVRITAQLIETRNSSHLWSETYDRTLDNIFAIQDEISAAIVGELKGYILGDEEIKAPEATRSANVEAYEHFMLGQQYLAKRTEVGIEKAKHHFEQGLAADPDYAPALVGLADAHLLLSNGRGSYGTTPLKQALADAEPLLAKALTQDDTSAESHGVMSLYSRLSGNSDEALVHAERALTLNPNYARGYHLLGGAYRSLGDPAAPILSTQRKAVELDPASLVLLASLATQYSDCLDFDRVEAVLDQMAVIDPGTPLLAGSRAILQVIKGEEKEALELLLAPEVAFSSGYITFDTLYYASLLGYAKQVEPIDPMFAMEGYLAMGQLEEARRLGPILVAKEGAAEDYDTALALATWYAREERYSEALALVTPFDEPDPDKWGRHFDEQNDYRGATLSLYLRGRLGKRASTRLYLDKLKELHLILERDPDGQSYRTDYIGAVIAAAGGDTEAALTALEHQIKRTISLANVLLSDVNFDSLKDEPRYQALLEKVETHLAGEKAKAEAAGLLPIPEELLARLNED